MAAPTRNLFGTATTGASNSSSLTVTMTTAASGSQVNDRICVFVANDSSSATNMSVDAASAAAGWQLISQVSDGAQVSLALFRFTVTVAGTVPDLVVQSAANEMMQAQWFRIRPSAGKQIASITPTSASGSSTNPNPASITNSTGAAQDIYYLAVWGGDGNNVVSTAAPTNYANHQSQGISNNQGTNIGSADRTRTAVANGGAEDPSTFTRSNEQWVTLTAAFYETNIVHSLTANSLTTSSPALASPALSQKHSMTANALAPSSPALASPALGQSHSLSADSLATAAPALDSPTLGGGGPFTPASLFGVGDVGYAWNPTDLSKVWQNSDGTGAGAFTQPIGRIDDISGLNNHPSQAGAGLRPILQNVANGMMKFDGSDDILSVIPCLWAGGAGTVIMAVKGPSQDGKFLFGETNSAASGAVWSPGLRTNVGGDMLFYWRGDNFTPRAVNQDVNLFDDTLKIYAIVDDGTKVDHYVDGSLVATYNYTSRATLTGGEATTINQAHIGNAMVGGLPYDNSTSAYVGAGIVIDRAVNSTELADSFTWIGDVHDTGATSLTADNLATGSPALSSPALTQVHALAADPLAPASPALASPAITQAQSLVADGLATGSPALGTPTLSITTSLAANDLATGSPALGSPAVGQGHSLTPDALATASPAIGTPALSQVHALTANGLATASPALQSPTLTQASALIADPLVTASPGLASPAIGQDHILAADGLATASPDLGTPTLGLQGTLIADNLVTGSPALGAPAIGQAHSLSADGLATSAPSLDQPLLRVTYFLTADALATSIPSLGLPALSQAHGLVANDLGSGSPALASPTLRQDHALVANDLEAGSPDLGAPGLNYVLTISQGGRVTMSAGRSRVSGSDGPSRLSSANSSPRETASFGELRVSRSNGEKRNA